MKGSPYKDAGRVNHIVLVGHKRNKFTAPAIKSLMCVKGSPWISSLIFINSYGMELWTMVKKT